MHRVTVVPRKYTEIPVMLPQRAKQHRNGTGKLADIGIRGEHRKRQPTARQDSAGGFSGLESSLLAHS